MKTKNLLGIFDSGLGGFSVLQEVKKITTSDILYFGDCARAPYGNRTEAEIKSFIKEILFNLQSQGVNHFISACNSMSVFTTDSLLRECRISNEKYIDMIRAFKLYFDIPPSARVLVLGTQSTINSQVYQTFLHDKVAGIFDYAPTSLAGFIEQGANDKELFDIIKPIICYAKETKSTHILYACTHYPLIHHIFKKYAAELEWKGDFIDPAVYVAKSVKEWNLTGDRQIDFQASKKTNEFISLSKRARSA